MWPDPYNVNAADKALVNVVSRSPMLVTFVVSCVDGSSGQWLGKHHRTIRRPLDEALNRRACSCETNPSFLIRRNSCLGGQKVPRLSIPNVQGDVLFCSDPGSPRARWSRINANGIQHGSGLSVRYDVLNIELFGRVCTVNELHSHALRSNVNMKMSHRGGVQRRHTKEN